jgi:hypothetical protein
MSMELVDIVADHDPSLSRENLSRDVIGAKARAQEASQCAISGSTLTDTGVCYDASSSVTQSTASPQARHSL